MKKILLLLLVISIQNVFAGGEKKICPAELIEFSAGFENDIIILEWATASEMNTDKFKIFRAVEIDRGKSEYEEIGQVDAAGSSAGEKNYSIEDKGFAGGKTNFYMIRIYDNDGSYSESAEISYQIENILFEEGHIFAPVLDGNRVKISWATTYEAEVDSFLVTRKIEDFSEETIIAKVKAFGNAPESVFYGDYYDNELTPNRQHDYRLYAIMNNGRVKFLEIESVNYITSVPGNNREYNSFAYPNPFNDYTFIKLPSNYSGRVECRIFDAAGNMVRTMSYTITDNCPEIRIDSRNLNSGIYYYLIKTGSEKINGIITVLK